MKKDQIKKIVSNEVYSKKFDQLDQFEQNAVELEIETRELNRRKLQREREMETILFAVKIGEPDFMEVVITTKSERIEQAKVWAKENGFDRFRIAQIDLQEKPDFTKTIK